MESGCSPLLCPCLIRNRVMRNLKLLKASKLIIIMNYMLCLFKLFCNPHYHHVQRVDILEFLTFIV
jgi:hypothetical protein